MDESAGVIVRTRLIPSGFAGFTVWPFIFIHPDHADDPGLIEHERVHLAEQARWLVLPWLAAYLLSRRFRRDAEVRAYRRQIDMGSVSVAGAAAALMKYRLGITLDKARSLLV